jgi:hypothetical protein
MVDIDKQIAYWRNGAAEDWSAGRDLIAYPHTLMPPPSVPEAEEYVTKVHEVLECLDQQF